MPGPKPSDAPVSALGLPALERYSEGVQACPEQAVCDEGVGFHEAAGLCIRLRLEDHDSGADAVLAPPRHHHRACCRRCLEIGEVLGADAIVILRPGLRLGRQLGPGPGEE